MKAERVAIFLIVGDVKGGGGIERFYLNFIHLNKTRTHTIDIITTGESKRHILELHPDFDQKRIKSFPVLPNRFNKFISRLVVGLTLKLCRYDLVHIANFDNYFADLYEFVCKTTKVSINIIDCRFAPEFDDDRYKNIKKFISKNQLKGVYSWYRNAESPIRMLNKNVYFKSCNFCFTDIYKFKPRDKKKQIVFAARLAKNKRPLDYLQAVTICMNEKPDLLNDWEFLLLGEGESEADIKTYLENNGLNEKVQTGYKSDLSTVFCYSSIFVSTQMYENFTSLSMLEAMSAGNAIISYDVGQTELFVKNGVNGLVVDENPKALALAILNIISQPELLEHFQKESNKIVREVHNIENFSKELSGFWQQCASL